MRTTERYTEHVEKETVSVVALERKYFTLTRATCREVEQERENRGGHRKQPRFSRRALCFDTYARRSLYKVELERAQRAVQKRGKRKREVEQAQ